MFSVRTVYMFWAFPGALVSRLTYRSERSAGDMNKFDILNDLMISSCVYITLGNIFLHMVE